LVVFIRIKQNIFLEREYLLRERVGSFYKHNIFLEIIGDFYYKTLEFFLKKMKYLKSIFFEDSILYYLFFLLFF